MGNYIVQRKINYDEPAHWIDFTKPFKSLDLANEEIESCRNPNPSISKFRIVQVVG